MVVWPAMAMAISLTDAPFHADTTIRTRNNSSLKIAHATFCSGSCSRCRRRYWLFLAGMRRLPVLQTNRSGIKNWAVHRKVFSSPVPPYDLTHIGPSRQEGPTGQPGGTRRRHSIRSPLFRSPLLGKLNRVSYFHHPFLPVTPMSTPDKLYDEAIELQQAGKLDEAVTRLESLAQSQPDFALAHAALALSIASKAVMARPWSRPSWSANWMPTTPSATWPRASSASGPA